MIKPFYSGHNSGLWLCEELGLIKQIQEEGNDTFVETWKEGYRSSGIEKKIV